MLSARTIIERAESFLSEGNNRKIKDIFLEKYSVCEVLCRPILRDYLKSIGKFNSDDDIKMKLQNIKDAVVGAGYFFEDKSLLSRIWGQAKQKGNSSCRFLRNKITHELMMRALYEVVERQRVLFADMDKFIEVLSSD